MQLLLSFWDCPCDVLQGRCCLSLHVWGFFCPCFVTHWRVRTLENLHVMYDSLYCGTSEKCVWIVRGNDTPARLCVYVFLLASNHRKKSLYLCGCRSMPCVSSKRHISSGKNLHLTRITHNGVTTGFPSRCAPNLLSSPSPPPPPKKRKYTRQLGAVGSDTPLSLLEGLWEIKISM